jgi:transcriptional regulator with XRE-family HTH domain
MVRAPTKLPDVVRRRIRELRRESTLTQEELCERAGISIDAISRIENGSRVPTLETIDAIAAALGVSPLVLFEGTVPKAPKKESASLKRITTLLTGADDAFLRLVEVTVTALVRARKAK